MQTPHATFNDPDAPAIVLIGARGSGKSMVGRLLADALSVEFIDLDDRTLALCSESSVAAVFERQGEVAWRKAEAAALTAALTSTSAVIATGGGAACIEPAQGVLRSAAATGRLDIVWLECDGATLRSRLARDIGGRPSLTGGDPVDEAIGLAAARASAYEDISTHRVAATVSPELVVKRIREILSR